MMVMNEGAIRFLMGLNPQVWETHFGDWEETYTNRSSDVAAIWLEDK